jgi:hypothetical protein
MSNLNDMLKKCLEDRDAVIDADLNFFCPEAQADKVSAIQ